MIHKKQITGMRGVFLVAAEMSNQGLIVTTTSRSAFGADILVTDDRCRCAFSIQVKTNSKSQSFWLLNKKSRKLASPSHVYVFVNLSRNDGPHEFYVVPSRIVSKNMYVERRPRSTWYSFEKKCAVKYRDKWKLFYSK